MKVKIHGMNSPIPSLTDYQAAMQNPNICLQDPELRQYSVELQPFGQPKVRSGGFALTYKLSNSSSKVAVRCFHKITPNLDVRYEKIGNYLRKNPRDFLVTVTYQKNGIKINNQYYPITKMPWIEGITLSQYIQNNYQNKELMIKLRNNLITIFTELTEMKVAHGDLSNLNIIVNKEKVFLVDYDGMFVPELKGQRSSELGNPNFQHPLRNEHFFDERLDRFSEYVLYLAISALIYLPSIFDKFGNGGEGLLFRKSDFIDPRNSQLLHTIEIIPELKEPVRIFRQICLTDLERIPSLDKGLNKKIDTLPFFNPEVSYASSSPSYSTINAQNREQLIRLEGEFVTVIGLVTGVYRGTTIKSDPYVMLNFSDYKDQAFTIPIWNDVLDQFVNLSKNPESFTGKIISITGTIQIYRSGSRIVPQIILDSPSQIEILPDNNSLSQPVSGSVQDIILARLNQNDKPTKIRKESTITSDDVYERALTKVYEKYYGDKKHTASQAKIKNRTSPDTSSNSALMPSKNSRPSIKNVTSTKSKLSFDDNVQHSITQMYQKNGKLLPQIDNQVRKETEKVTLINKIRKLLFG